MCSNKFLSTIILVLLFFAGFLFGYSLGLTKGKTKGSIVMQTGGKDVTIDELRQKLDDDPRFKDAAVCVLSGKVLSVAKNSLQIESTYQSRNPLVELPSTRKVLVNDQTKVFLRLEKTSEQIEQERADFAAARAVYTENIKKGKTDVVNPPLPPTSYQEVEVDLSKLQNNSEGLFYCQNNEDIRDKAEFTASQIIIVKGQTDN